MPMEPVRLEHDGTLAILTLDHPPLNLFDQTMIKGLARSIDELTSAPPRGLLIRAQGHVVSGGVDVHIFAGTGRDDAARLFHELLAITHAVEALPCPTVFAAHALTLTAAFELALGCDLIVASRAARFGLVEIVVGQTPAMGGTPRLAERAGPGRARELVMTGELFDAEMLQRWGVVNRVFDNEDFVAESRALAAKLASGPTLAHRATKQIIRAYLDGGTSLADRVTPDTVADLYESEDLVNAVRSFLTDGPGHATYVGR
jgi:enoyl-CoA hydratase